MTTKMNGVAGKAKTLSNVPSELLNPFVHQLELATAYDKFKTGVLTLLLLPVRVIAIAVLLVLAWLLACIGLIGLTDQELREKPLIGWRRRLVRILSWLGRSTYQAGGMQITIKGRQVTRKEAPVLVIAPHSTFMDAVIVYVTGFPSIIARRESGLNPFIGKLINYTQPVYVWRDDPNSRQNTIKEIIQRATSDQDWPQVLIFPEGTCTNRSCLITFKPGAFYPGVPIQPVCIRYPNKLDTVTWTWEGPGALKLLWLTLTQLNSSCEIEFLPVYHPSPEEQADPKLYANNVRDLMAKALGIPVSDYTYADCLLINRALELNIPSASDLIKVQKLRIKLGLLGTTLEQEVEAAAALQDTWIGLTDFCDILKISEDDPLAAQLFSVFDKDNSGSIDIRSYLLDCLVIYKKPKTEEMVRLAFKVMSGITDKVSKQGAVKAMRLSLGLSPDQAERIYGRVDKAGEGHITYVGLVSYARRRKRFDGIFSSQGGDSSASESQISEDSTEHHPHNE